MAGRRGAERDSVSGVGIGLQLKVSRGDFTLECTLRLPAAGVTAVLGPSGSGKTTLLRVVAGLEYERDVFVSIGSTVWQEGRHFVPPHRRSVGMVFQEPSLFDHLTVRGNIEYGLKRVRKERRQVAFEQVVELAGVADLLRRKPQTLSGGERQRVAIARALAVSPRLLLMDEPLAAVDEPRRQELVPMIAAVQKALRIPVIYVTHATSEAAQLADHLVLLNRGRVVASGSINEMIGRLDLPLAQDRDAAAVVEARVCGYDPRYHLTELEFSGGRIMLVRQRLPAGESVRLRIAARDVSIALERPNASSILNVFPASVEALDEQEPGQVMVRLRAGQAAILARISRKSADQLQLVPGSSVFVQVKSMALVV